MHFSTGTRAGFLAWARFAAVALAMLATSVVAQTLYATTVRRYVGPSELGGALYVVDPKTAKAKLVGPLRIPGLRSVGVTGLAVHPRTKVLYGITAGLTPELRPSLITIDPRTAEAKLVGPLGSAGTDINFDAKGNLLVWFADSNELGKIDLATGAATSIGPSGLAGAGGGLAIDRKGTVYVAPNTAAGTLDIVDTRTGAGTPGPTLTGAGLAFKALKPRERGPGVVARCVNLTRSVVEGSWVWPTAVSRAFEARLDETPVCELGLEEGGCRVRFRAAPRATVTIVVEP